MNDLHDLELLLRSRVPLVTIETRDETRVTQLFASLAIRLGMPVMSWSATTGLQRIDLELAPQRHASEPQQALGQVKATTTPTIYLLLDFHPYLDDAYNVRLLSPRSAPPSVCHCRTVSGWRPWSARRPITGPAPTRANRSVPTARPWSW
jgi:hypothetical protein